MSRMINSRKTNKTVRKGRDKSCSERRRKNGNILSPTEEEKILKKVGLYFKMKI